MFPTSPILSLIRLPGVELGALSRGDSVSDVPAWYLGDELLLHIFAKGTDVAIHMIYAEKLAMDSGVGV